MPREGKRKRGGSVRDVDFTFVEMTDEDARKINEWQWDGVYRG